MAVRFKEFYKRMILTISEFEVLFVFGVLIKETTPKNESLRLCELLWDPLKTGVKLTWSRPSQIGPKIDTKGPKMDLNLSQI